MALDVNGGLELLTLLTSILLLILGLGVIVQLIRRGGFELAMAHLVGDPDRRSLFLKALCTSLAALFGLGFIVSVEALLGAPLVVVGATETGLFIVGAIGIIVLMRDAVKSDPLSLRETWNLQYSAERGMTELARVPVDPGRADGPGSGRSARGQRDAR